MISVHLYFPGAGMALVVLMPAWPEIDQILSFALTLKRDTLFGPYVDKKWIITSVEHRFGRTDEGIAFGHSIARLREFTG